MIETRAPHILIIDDQSAIHEDYRKILGKQAATSSTALGKAAADLFGDDPSTLVDWEGFELHSAFQGQEGFELVKRSIAQRRPYAMAFVDIRMPPGWDGIETVRRIWEVDPEILIVICSAYSDYSWQEMVRDLGRSDRYLILKKPFDNIEVRQCAMALTERWSVSRADVLTGLLNRRAFSSYLDLEWGRSARHQLSLACGMVDLDYFKRVNDTFGHQAGDFVLKTVANTLHTICRASDLVCRYGGEEICVLLPHTNEQEAAAWADKARRAIESSPIVIGNRSVELTASIGVAERLPTDDSTERLVHRADQALSRAKAMGRNCVVAYSTMNRVAAPSDTLAPRVDPWEGVTLRDVMTSPVVSLNSAATAGEAARFLLQFHTEAALVIGPDENLVGLVSEDDLIGLLSDSNAGSVPVDRVMRRSIECFDEDAPTPSICELLCTTAVRRVVIVRDGRPIGVVSRRNVLRWYDGRNGAPAVGKSATPLHVAGEVDSARLIEGVQAVKRHAMQLSQGVSEQGNDPVLSVVASVAELQGLIDNVLTCSQTYPAPGDTPDGVYLHAMGSPSGPLAPRG